MEIIQKRVDFIKKLKKDQCWYITKQTLDFNYLCFLAQIVEEYSKDNSNSNFKDFYTNKAKELGIKSNYRATNNCF